MFVRISYLDFNIATQGAVVLRGGDMLDEGTYSEYEADGKLYRYERDAGGTEGWFVFEPSAGNRTPMQRALANEHAMRERDYRGGVL